MKKTHTPCSSWNAWGPYGWWWNLLGWWMMWGSMDGGIYWKKRFSNPGTPGLLEPVKAFVFAFVIWASCAWGVKKWKSEVGWEVFVCNKERFYYNLQQLCKTILDYTTQTMYIYIYTYLWIQNHICADRRSMYVLEILALGERKHDHIGVTSCHIGDALMIGYVSPVSNRDEAKQLRMMRDQPQNIKTFHQASWIFSFWLLVKKLHLWGWIFPPPFKVPPTF